MSETVVSQELVLSDQQQQELKSKQNAWGSFAEKVYRTELSLQMQVANQRQKLQLPTAVEHIAAAEQQLVELKKARKAIEEQRKAVTGTLDKLASRLMEPEKQMDVLTAELSSALLPLKQKYEQLQRAKREKETELQQLVAAIKKAVADHDMACRSKINTKITVAYQYALDNDVKPEEIETFLEKAAKKFGVVDFELEKPDLKPRHHLPEEISLIMDEHFRNNPFAYLDMYHRDLKAKFVDYAVAYKNKADAIALAAKEAEDREAQLKSENEQKQLAAQMEATATRIEAPTVVGAPVKALKRCYEVDMPDTPDSAIAIIAAYVANRSLCGPKTRIQKWLTGFTPAAAAKALAAVKNDDNAFQPSGVVFKEVEKL